ncbi:hypothetical protein GCM10009332_00580 [Shewanella gelidii]|uniref:Uncharacterized protein n=1 Tax=Shewanella gelidii TaxID=1642821 RepID=A0A917N5I4_9GAMM|nr:hypothetical protein GCM10009332_00580 [Shewanella gelidii]
MTPKNGIAKIDTYFINLYCKSTISTSHLKLVILGKYTILKKEVITREYIILSLSIASHCPANTSPYFSIKSRRSKKIANGIVERETKVIHPYFRYFLNID